MHNTPDQSQSLPLRLIAAFEAAADRAPTACAVSYGAARLSYSELDRRANQLARHLRARGTGPDDIVALSVPRSVDMVVCVLAVLKAGAGYAPLDPAYPAERLTFMLSDTRARVLLTTSQLASQLPAANEVVLVDAHAVAIAAHPDTRLPDETRPEHLAYVIYTSGSTGNPKGVAMPRGPLENLIQWQLSDSKVVAGERTLQFAPLSFDVHFQELFGTWAAGGELVLVDEELRLDTRQLLLLLEDRKVARLFLPFVALQSLCDVATLQGLYPSALREVITAGEQLVITKSVAGFFTALPSCSLHNHYGPSETHVVTSYTLRGEPHSWPRIPPIGRPIANTTLHILDEAGSPVANGSEGELYFGGVCLARGYLHRPDLTDAKFVPDRFSSVPGARLYRTGDLARLRDDGECEFLGRLDTQVKVRGYRIELGEIDVALDAHPAVQQAVTIAREDEPGNKRLVAYVMLQSPVENIAAELRRHLASKLPEYMLPAAFVAMPDFPRTPSGKVDRRSLPVPEAKRPELATRYVAAASELEQALSKLWASLLQLDRVGVLDNFFELGGNSLLALKTVAHLHHAHKLDLPVTKIFAEPNVRALAGYLEGGVSTTTLLHKRRTAGAADEPIAIIGMSGRFPGAPDLSALWEVLQAGRDTTSAFAGDQLDASVPQAQRDASGYVKRRGVIADADKFDSAFFGVNPREADVIDPQQRVLLELAWSALEDAGYTPESAQGAVGVFAGTHNNQYFTAQLQRRPDVMDAVGSFLTMVSNEKDYVATRIAHKLNLTGPALSVHTACSTSLVAIALAAQSLRSGECDLALAGAAAVTVPQNIGHLYQQGGMLSNDGHTRSFDASASGTSFSDGAAMIALKRLSDAVADGDAIRAVIRGVATNNDGGDKASFTAPSALGQAQVIAAALRSAQVDARSISYVEAHGTGTPLGDPIEVEGLTRAYREQTSERGYCALGSIKSNFGHLTAAAGVAGVIKTVLALEHELLPATVHFKKPNPNIAFDSSPFFVLAQSRAWPRTGPAQPRRAGVSSFGVGGTNAHVIVEEAPPREPQVAARPVQLLLLSAKTPAALARASENLVRRLRAQPALELSSVAYTLHAGRRAFDQRRFVLAGNLDQAIEQLERPAPNRAGARAVERSAPPVVFMFPGQGAQYVGMGASLYRDEPLFKVVVDQCAETLLPHIGRDLREILYPKDPSSSEAAEILRRTEYTQPALFTIEYALATLWQSWGVKPALLIGHSVGEFVSAVLASVMSLDDALRLVAVRAKLIQSLPAGSMLSVRMPATQLASRLGPDLAIASSNGPSTCVVAGPSAKVEALQAQLTAEGVVAKPLHTSHAFHSPMMDAAVEPFAVEVRKVTLRAPQIPFISTVTGLPAGEKELTDPLYWARHLRQTVRFDAAISEAWRVPERVLLEIGPRNALATLARQQVSDRDRQLAVSSLADSVEGEWSALLQAVGQLWLADVPVRAERLYESQPRQRVSLPTYPFERRRHWVDAPALGAVAPLPAAIANPVSANANGARSFAASPALSPKAPTMNTQTQPSSHRAQIAAQLTELLDSASGIDLSEENPQLTFLELGFDSLLLTQVAMSLKKQFGIEVGFRTLLEELSNLDRLTDHVASVIAPTARSVPPMAAAASAQAQPLAAAPLLSLVSAPAAAAVHAIAAPSGSVQALVEAQIALMREQLALMSGAGLATVQAPAAPAHPHLPTQAHETAAPSPAAPTISAVAPWVAATPSATPEPARTQYLEGEEPPKAIRYDVKTAFGAIARIHVTSDVSLTSVQQDTLAKLTHDYTSKTKGSKQWAQDNRSQLADPRVVTGFRPPIKELIYPILAVRSAGSRVWDVDGNEYIDALNGFGSNFLGHASPVVRDALKQQIDTGYEIGPMQPSVGASAKLFCELTGLDRAAFCNTGSEAVMGALRIARTVTGRSLVVVFGGSYHGIFDEVIVRGTKRLRSIPAAPGIMPEGLANVLVLDYGTPESLALIKERAHELAAVMVEPVQSRRPDFQPVEFLRELRGVTERAGCAYIWDEVITGFRSHPGGAQALFGVRADLATYGKVPGGGLPLGVIAGQRKWMDALDGGHWSFGDDSVPTVGVTYFAGTFVRHPLTMAATEATLRYLKEQGPGLQRMIAGRTERLAQTINEYLESKQVPVKIKHFSSLWKTFYLEDHPMQDLLFCYLRLNGIHIWDGFPCFLTAAHSEADVDLIIEAYKKSVDSMLEAGFLPGRDAGPAKLASFEMGPPPVAGARLGRTPAGDPAWFVPNPEQRGKFMKYEAR